MEEVEESLHTTFAVCFSFLLLLDSNRLCGCGCGYAWAVRDGYLSSTDIDVCMVVTAGRGFLLIRPPTTLLLHLLLLLRMVIVFFELAAVAPLRPRTAQRSDHSDRRMDQI